MREYVMTHEHLNQVTLGNLGKMAPGTSYEEFMQKAREVAAAKGVKNPLLLIAMKYKPDMNEAQLTIVSGDQTTSIEMERSSTQVVYPIADVEWRDFVTDISVYLTGQPDVHVVDGDLYTAPI